MRERVMPEALSEEEEVYVSISSACENKRVVYYFT